METSDATNTTQLQQPKHSSISQLCQDFQVIYKSNITGVFRDYLIVA